MLGFLDTILFKSMYIYVMKFELKVSVCSFTLNIHVGVCVYE